MDLEIWQQDTVVCPHCKHRYTSDELNESCGDVDIWEVAHGEDTAELECPVCDQHFWVQGTYLPRWSTAFAEEQF